MAQQTQQDQERGIDIDKIKSSRDFLKLHMNHPIVPLPPVLHQVVTDEDIGGRDIFIVGDIHGCLDEFKALQKKAGVTPQTHCIICVGDNMNKGNHNRAMIHYIHDHKILAVRGNHEGNVYKQWHCYRQAAAKGETYTPEKSYYEWCQYLTEDEMQIMMNWPYTLSIPQINKPHGAVVVHAGILPGRPFDEQYPKDMVVMRNLSCNDKGQVEAEEDDDVGVAWAPLWHGPRHVYFGHNASRGLQQYKYATGLDTGCYKGKLLTGMFLSGPRTGEHLNVQSNGPYYTT